MSCEAHACTVMYCDASDKNDIEWHLNSRQTFENDASQKFTLKSINLFALCRLYYRTRYHYVLLSRYQLLGSLSAFHVIIYSRKWYLIRCLLSSKYTDVSQTQYGLTSVSAKTGTIERFPTHSMEYLRSQERKTVNFVERFIFSMRLRIILLALKWFLPKHKTNGWSVANRKMNCRFSWLKLSTERVSQL